MCGITGFYGLHDSEMLNRMSDAIIHRGPDDAGIFEDDTVGLAHRRLSIIDISCGHQPIVGSDGKTVIIYNGEVYNYKELRKELEEEGVVFKTHSDTEVLLECFIRYGSECFDRFNGMFAIAFYNQETGKLTLCRDHFGIKPLYYYQDQGVFFFGSELKAILASGRVKPRVNERSMYRYLMFRVQDDARETFFEGIERVMPGEMIEVDSGGVQRKQFTRLKEELTALAKKKGHAYSRHIMEEYQKRLIESVSMRLDSEVRVGTSLSGGLDSSSVCAIIATILDSDENAKSVGDRQNTFSAVFPNSVNDEEKYVDALLGKYAGRITAHKIKPNAVTFFEDLSDFVRTQEEPIISTGPYAQYVVMRHACQHVKVLLDGQGADEMMAGYDPYFVVYLRQLKARKQYGKLLKEAWACRDIISRLVKFKLKSKAGFGKKGSAGVRSFLKDDFVGEYRGERFEKCDGHLKMRLLDDIFRNSLPSLLRYEDKNTMRFSIEGRVPFIDKELLKFLFSLDDEAIIHRGYNKRILRESMDTFLPKMISRRRNKIGFTTPEVEWFQKNAAALSEIFRSESFRTREWFHGEKIAEEFKKWVHGTSDYDSMTFWRFLNVEMWLREFIDAAQ